MDDCIDEFNDCGTEGIKAPHHFNQMDAEDDSWSPNSTKCFYLKEETFPAVLSFPGKSIIYWWGERSEREAEDEGSYSKWAENLKTVRVHNL